ncbi:hypothetical protein B0T22DRAFT_128641 [Podospora appendiculata]|uniref:SUR7 protein n=1 Tax=Podospora appendiculata TaxID=314037 RepID=A0AAE0X7G2_9PEZI|nr:hypothetical protein B0T22DRAFT_128641 [Podospora appendiculata]
MAQKQSTLRRSLLNLLPAFFAFFSYVLILLLLLAGLNNGLTHLCFLKTNTSKLSIPSKLSGSSFLKDLSTVSGTDFVGQNITTTSLGLADLYTTNLLSSCAQFADGSVSCTRASVSFSWDPITALQLDLTSLQGTYSDALIKSISSYSKVSHYIVGSFISSAVLTGITTLSTPWAATFSVVASGLATIILLSASIAAAVVFRNLSNALNAEFGASGLSSTPGNTGIALSFAAFAFSLLAAIILAAHSRANPASRRGRSTSTRSKGGKENSLLGGEEGGDDIYAKADGASTKKSGFMDRIPLVNRHKYIQVERQPAIATTDVEGQQTAVLSSASSGTRTLNSPSSGRQTIDSDWTARDEYSHGNARMSVSEPESDAEPDPDPEPAAHPPPKLKSEAPKITITSIDAPLLPLGGNSQTRDMNAAYEPFSNSIWK